MTPAKPADKPSVRTRRDKEAHGTPEQPRETRVSRHKHRHPRPPQGREGNNQVSPRETPSNHMRTTSHHRQSHLEPPQGRGPTSRTTMHLRHSTRSGNYTYRCHHE
ncbi:hypothetical protein Taro_044508 [Colocasia esculenta]|uniref:Uncharacterized protein n=1 Tax=Colocasia esculenta TaxID=4460 RepID=A0A843X5J3_COLES|nr:hypothetical protein [Colocasia esculenta]